MGNIPKGVKIGCGISFGGICTLSLGVGCFWLPGAFLVLGLGIIIMGGVLAGLSSEYDR